MSRNAGVCWCTRLAKINNGGGCKRWRESIHLSRKRQRASLRRSSGSVSPHRKRTPLQMKRGRRWRRSHTSRRFMRVRKVIVTRRQEHLRNSAMNLPGCGVTGRSTIGGVELIKRGIDLVSLGLPASAMSEKRLHSASISAARHVLGLTLPNCTEQIALLNAAEVEASARFIRIHETVRMYINQLRVDFPAAGEVWTARQDRLAAEGLPLDFPQVPPEVLTLFKNATDRNAKLDRNSKHEGDERTV